MHEEIAALLKLAQSEIRDLRRQAATLPAEVAAPFMATLEELMTESQRLAHAAKRMHDH